MCAAAVSAVLEISVDHVSSLAGIHAAAGHMLVRIKMILAVFVVSLALGTEAENKIRVVEFCPAADGAFMAARFSCVLWTAFSVCALKSCFLLISFGLYFPPLDMAKYTTKFKRDMKIATRVAGLPKTSP